MPEPVPLPSSLHGQSLWLVTDELRTLSRLGGLGLAFESVAQLLVRAGANVTLVYSGPVPAADRLALAAAVEAASGARLVLVPHYELRTASDST